MQIRKTWKTFSLVSQVCEAEVRVGMVSEKISTTKISQAVYIEQQQRCLLWVFLLNCPGVINGKLKDMKEWINFKEILLRKRASRAAWLGFLSLYSAVWHSVALVQGCLPIALADGILLYCLYDAGLTGMQM